MDNVKYSVKEFLGAYRLLDPITLPASSVRRRLLGIFGIEFRDFPDLFGIKSIQKNGTFEIWMKTGNDIWHLSHLTEWRMVLIERCIYL